jgi:predicted GNAT family acetyltransferase
MMRTMITISHDANEHRFSTEVEGSAAYLDYTLADGVMTVTHTRVPPAIGGRGIAAKLMGAALDAAGKAGWSVHPVCSYAVAYMARYAADSSQRHTDELLDEALDESFPASDSPAVGGVS